MLFSASGIATLRACERQFFYRYFMKKLVGHAGTDCDTPPMKAAVRGSIIHELWEKVFETGELPSLEKIQGLCHPTHSVVDKATRTKTVSHILNPEEAPVPILLAVKRYLEFSKIFAEKTGLKELCQEVGFQTASVRGFVDAILYDPSTKKWALQDKKTAAAFGDDDITALAQNPQINTYVLHLAEIIEIVKQRTGVELDESKFLGFFYCQIKYVGKTRKKVRGSEKILEKPTDENGAGYDQTIVMEPNSEAYSETLEEFFARLDEGKDRDGNVRQTFVPREKIDPVSFWHEQLKPSIERGLEIELAFAETGEAQGCKDTSNCINRYNSPCAYWSQCHGKTRSECFAEAEQCVDKLFEDK